MNSECLLIRCISQSVPYHPPVILSLVSYMHINDLILYSHVYHLFTVLVRLLAFLLLLHNFISSSLTVSSPSFLSCRHPLAFPLPCPSSLFLPSHLLLAPHSWTCPIFFAPPPSPLKHCTGD